MQQSSIKGIENYKWVGGKGDPQGIVQEIKIWPHTPKWYMHKPESILENKMYKILWDFQT